MKDNNIFLNLGNAFTRLLLRSPAHKMISKNTILITYAARDTGESVTLPVNYAEYDGGILVASPREREWWKNLRNGAPVTLSLYGRRIETWAETIEDPEQVSFLFEKYLRSAPKTAKYLGFEQSDGISYETEEFKEAAAKHIMVRIKSLKT